MRPSSRIDVVIVPADPDRSADVPGLREALGDGTVLGRCAAFHIDDPGRNVFWSNHQGGFRVRCPVSGESIVPAFDAAMSTWRAGGRREVACGCGRIHPLEALDYAPPAAFSRVAVVMSDASDIAPDPDGLAIVARFFGDVRVVVRRVG